jgi:hypothetical protein
MITPPLTLAFPAPPTALSPPSLAMHAHGLDPLDTRRGQTAASEPVGATMSVSSGTMARVVDLASQSGLRCAIYCRGKAPELLDICV